MSESTLSKTIRRSVPSTLLLAMLTVASGCATGDAPNAEPNGEGVASTTAPRSLSEPLRVESSAASRTLGVAFWEVAEALGRGVGDQGQIVVEFHIDTATDTVHSVFPTAGTIPLLGDRSASTMREDVQRLYDAMREDFIGLADQYDA